MTPDHGTTQPTTTTLRITADDVTPEQHSKLVQAIRDAGIRQNQITMATSDAPSGPLLWVSIALFAAAVAMLLAWVWTGDWRWGPTAAIMLPAAVVCLGLAIPKTAGRRKG